jgi:tetratricopeptide (TPR) repeat protein
MAYHKGSSDEPIQDAISSLKRAVQLGAEAQRENAHYYLALAYLKVNQPAQALSELDAVIEINGEHRSPAESLKQQVLKAIQ